MKRSNYFVLLAAILSLAVSCQKDEDSKPDPVQLEKPFIRLQNATSSAFTVAWDAVENAASYAYTVDNGGEESTTDLFFTKEELTAGTYTVRVKAVASDKDRFTDSAWAELEIAIETQIDVQPEGSLPGLFSVGEGKQVRFAQGNLQYNAAQDVWRFAENQYDIIGEGNLNTAPDYDGWIDLFSYGYSGYDGKNPYDVVPYPDNLGTVYIDPIVGTNFDWGVYNPISNGGNEAGLWRTPTFTEMYYIFHTRDNAEKLFALATVGGVTGAILLPDGFSGVDGIDILAATDAGMFKWSDQSYNYTDNNTIANHYEDNIFDLEQWQKIEEAGAVFFPTAGYRSEYLSEITYSHNPGMYWLSESEVIGEPSWWAGRFTFDTRDIGPGSDVTWNYGQAVRLAQDVTGN